MRSANVLSQKVRGLDIELADGRRVVLNVLQGGNLSIQTYRESSHGRTLWVLNSSAIVAAGKPAGLEDGKGQTMSESELQIRTAPRQKFSVKASRHGLNLEIQIGMNHHQNRGWATVAQIFLNPIETAQLRDFLTRAPESGEKTTSE